MIDAVGREDGFLRLADGEDLVDALGRLTAETPVFLAGIGMVRNAVIGYWKGAEYAAARIGEPAELVSRQGNIALRCRECVVHVHLCLAGADGVARGGPRVAATVGSIAEIALRLAPQTALDRIEEEGRPVLHPRLRSTTEDAD